MTIEQLYQHLKEVRKQKGMGNKEVQCWLPGTYIKLNPACFHNEKNILLLEGNVVSGGF